MGDHLQSRAQEFAHLESLDCGKPVTEAEGDIQCCVDLLHYYADIAPTVITTEALAVPDAHFSSAVHHAALGVVGCITPWNYPLMQV